MVRHASGGDGIRRRVVVFRPTTNGRYNNHNNDDDDDMLAVIYLVLQEGRKERIDVCFVFICNRRWSIYYTQTTIVGKVRPRSRCVP